MFCEKCGNQINDDSKMCAFCGYPVNNENANCINTENNANNTNGVSTINEIPVNPSIQKDAINGGKKKKGIAEVIVGAIIFVVLLFSCTGNKSGIPVKPSGANSVETARKMMEFTTLTKLENGDYRFYYNGDSNIHQWFLQCGSLNNCIGIYDERIADIFINYGGDAFKEKYYFIYGMDEKRASIYFDEEMYGVSIVTYYFETDKFQCNKEGNHYTLAKEFENYLRENGVVDLMKEQIDLVEKQVNSHNITFNNMNSLARSYLDSIYEEVKDEIDEGNSTDNTNKNSNENNDLDIVAEDPLRDSADGNPENTITDTKEDSSADKMYFSSWNGEYEGGWLDTILTFVITDDLIKGNSCGYVSMDFRKNLTYGTLYYIEDNQFYAEFEHEDGFKEEYYICTESMNDLPCLDIYLKDGEYETTFSMCGWYDENYSGEEMQDTEYILPDSNKRYLSEEELYGLTADECRIARNELYARYGRRFNDEALQSYFDSCSWYYGTIAPEEFDESVLNEYEKANRELIIQYEKDMGYR